MQAKKTMRIYMQTVLNSLDVTHYEQRSKQIIEQLLLLPSIKEGKTIAVTISNFPEVNTNPLIETLWGLGKQVVIPKVNKKTKEMTFYAFTNWNQLENVYLNLLEPKVEVCAEIKRDEIDICIVPGIVFDSNGYRIGFGGGYYDRFLQNFKGNTVSIAFNEQVVASVPVEIHDLPVDRIVTDQRMIVIDRK